MIRPGLVSVTFRSRPPGEVADLAAQAGLSGVEWGGDLHVPHGDTRAATTVAALTRDAGLDVAAYGSYYRVGHGEDEGDSFGAVLASAVDLGAHVIRVWAGRRGSAEADNAYRDRVVADALRIVEMAHGAGIDVAYENHRGTLTDTDRSARELLHRVDHPSSRTLWQPSVPESLSGNVARLAGVLPKLANVHVFAWSADRSRLPLARGRDEWRRYLATVATTGRDHWALLEFVRRDDPDQMFADALVLSELLDEVAVTT
ncbi:MAG: sugar phosphate isomerase/epimerase family protein [Jiangellaceae bacterium]